MQLNIDEHEHKSLVRAIEIAICHHEIALRSEGASPMQMMYITHLKQAYILREKLALIK